MIPYLVYIYIVYDMKILYDVVVVGQNVENGSNPERKAQVVTKTAVLGVGSRDIVMTAYSGNVSKQISYSFKCVSAGAGCSADAAGVPVSGVLSTGVSQTTGVIRGLDPATEYDCYVVTSNGSCYGKLKSVKTEPVVYVTSWGSLGEDTPSGDVLACDIEYSVEESQSSIGSCNATASIINGNDAYPYSISVNGSTAFFVYYYRPGTTGVRACDVSVNGSVLTDCVDAYGPEDAAESGRYVSDVDIVGDNAYLGIESGEVLVCSVGSNGSFTDCNATGPMFEGLMSVYSSPDESMLYVIGGNISVCSIAKSGSLVDCTLAYDNNSTDQLWAMAIRGNYAYITVNEGTQQGVLLCSVAPEGTLQNCTPTGKASDINGPTGIAIVGNQAFVSTYSATTIDGENSAMIWVCRIQSNGKLNKCSDEAIYSPSSGILDITI
jgi:hypothetical protein